MANPYDALVADMPAPSSAPSDNPYDAIVEDIQVQQQKRARTVYEKALATNPDQAAEAVRLSKQTGLPVDTVERNLDDVRRKEQARMLDLQRLAADSPVLARQLADPTFTKQAHDDVGTLTQIAQFFRNTGSAAKAGVFGASEGAAGVFRAGFELAAPALDVLEPVTAIGGNPLRRLAEGFDLLGTAAGNTRKAAMPKGDGNIESGYYSGIQSLTQNVLALPMAFLPGGQGAALTMMTATTGGQSYQEARTQGLTMAQALPYAASQAAIEYATEKLPLGQLIGDVKAGTGILKTLAKQMALEIPGEQIATILQDMNDWAVLPENKDKTFSDYIAERPDAAAQTLVATIVGTGGNVAVVKGIEAATRKVMGDAYYVGEAEQQAEQLQAAMQTAGQAMLRQRNPDEFRNLMQQMADDTDGAPKEVYVDAEVLNQLPQDVLQALPETVLNQMGEALAANDVVSIPVADVLTIAPGTPLEQALIENARIGDPMAMTQAEAKVAGDRAQQYLAQEAERIIQQAADAQAMQAGFDYVKTNIADQLNTASRFSKDVNDAYATLQASFFTTMAGRLGITPQEMFERYTLKASAQGQTAGVLDQITPEQAMATNVPMEMPTAPEFAEAVGNTPGAQVTENGLLIDLVRFQKPEQEGAQAIRTGVFYLPAKSADARHYRNAKTGYGGGERFAGNTLIRRPLFVKGATGGAAPEQAYKTLKGKAAFDEMSRAVTQTIVRGGNYMRPDPALKLQLIEEFLDQYAPESTGLAREIERVSREGNTLRYALQEIAVAHAVREAGYDAVVGYSKAKAGARISEVFDVREQTFPARGMDSEVHEAYNQSAIPDTIEVDGQTRQTTNSNGKPIAQTEEGVRNFWRWFGDSKVVDDQGRPLVVYHGSPDMRFMKEDATFKSQKDRLGFGQAKGAHWFTTDLRTARSYADPRRAFDYQRAEEGVIEAYIKLENPLIVEAAGMEWRTAQKRGQTGEVINEAQVAGNDGVIINNVKDDYNNGKGTRPTRTFTVFTSEQIKSATGNSGEFDGANPNILKQSAFHGSPHKFDKFMLDHIGTGEGNQAFGWGLYFAGNKEVAEFYRSMLGGDTVTVDGKLLRDIDPLQADVAKAVARGRSLDQVIAEQTEDVAKWARRLEKNPGNEDIMVRGFQAQQRLDAAKSLVGAEIKEDKGGQLYEVDIPEDDTMLLWDKPLSEQPEKVRAALRQMVSDGEFGKTSILFEEQTGREAYAALAEMQRKHAKKGANLEQLASILLNDNGISGIKYLDGTSRTGGDGSFNYVIFDDNAVEILQTYYQGQQQQARATFNPATLEIVLNDNADLSSFLHESGHFFLEVMADIASRPDAPAEIADDMAALLKWFGLSDIQTWQAMTLDEKRKYHERFAESFEQYLLEGKAPSVELAPLFRKFKRWMEHVYRSLKNFIAQHSGRSAQAGETLGQGALHSLSRDEFLGSPKITGNANAADLVPRAYKFLDAVQAEPFAVDGYTVKYHESGAAVFDGDKVIASYNSGDTLVVDKKHRRKGIAEELVYQWRTRYPAPAVATTRTKASQVIQEKVWARIERERSQTLAQGTNTDGSNIVLNDDIRQVFDRMLASREQIAQAEEVAGLLPDENATEAAVEKLTARSLRDLKWTVNARNKAIKALQKQAAGLRKEVEAEVRAEVDAIPVYAAQAELAKLNKGRRKATELEVATVADSFGFPDVDTMNLQIAAATPRADMIEGMTDQRMLERHGDLVDQRAIEEAANEAVHNEARARSLATELKAQADMLGARQDTGETNAAGRPVTVSVIAEAAKQFAANVVAKTPIAQLKSRAWQHVAAERRAGKRWQEATSAGKTEEAVKAKQDQVLNNAAAKAANEAQAEAKKIVEFFRRVVKDGNEKTVEKDRDPDVVNAARAVLAAYGVAPRAGKSALEYMEIVQRNDPAMFAALQPSIQGALNSAQPLDALTMDELRNLHDEIQSMWHLAKRSRQMEVDGNMLDLDDAEEQLQARMQEIGVPDTMPGDSGALTPKEERARKLQTALSLLTRAEQWADGMGKEFTRLIFQPIKDAADRYRADRVKYRKKYQALVDQVAPFMPKGLIEAPELGYTFGRGHNGIGMAELLHAILHTGNESNKRKLLLGRKWATENPDGTLDTSRWDAFVQRLIDAGTLKKEHYDFAQGVWDLLEETKPLAQKTHRDVFGRYFAEVTADKFTTPFGEYRGGYVPAQADGRLVQDKALRDLAEQENENMAFAFPATNRGFTKSRTEYNRPLVLDLRTIGQHLDKVLLFAHMEPAARDVNRLLTRKGISYSLGRIDPTIYEGMLTPWLNRSAKQIVETPVVGDGRLSRVLSVARSRAGMALMFANVSNTLQQLTGFSLAAVKVKPANMMRAMAQFVAHPKDTRAAVADASTFMANRMENEVSAINDAMDEIMLDPSLLEKAQAWTQRHAYFLQTAMANTMEPIIWTAAYNEAIQKGENDKDAVRFADSVIRTTQGSTLPEDVSRFETGPAALRLFTQFVGYFNMMANTNAAEFKKVREELGLKKGMGRFAYIAMAGLLIPLWTAEAIAIAMRGGPDDEDDDGYLDDWLAAVFGMGTIKGAFAMVPVLGQFANAGLNRMNDNPADDRVSLSPAVSLAEGTVGALSHVVKAAQGENVNARNAVRDAATAISLTLGLPAYAVARPLGYMAGVEDGRITPTSEFDMARGLITGSASPESK